MPTTSPRTRLGRIAVVGVTALALLGGLLAAPAGAQTGNDESARLRPTPEQLQRMGRPGLRASPGG
ncbi:MAG TPA: hypothetical protein PKA98_06090 [Acidimicrobiales bacterium]|nr:hypothetical protein [Acidimicrobiales bacterium]